jgi:parallel beta-helix repeat protein
MTTTFNVRDYGAVGDGVHDDTSAIQDAINAAQASSGGSVVFMPNGVYLLTSSLIVGCSGTVFCSGITLQGAGQANTTLTVAQNVTFIPVIVKGDSANIYSWGYHELCDFSVYMAIPASAGNVPAIRVEHCLFTKVRRVGILNFATGLYCVGNTQFHGEEIYIASASTAPTVVGVYVDGTVQNASIYFMHCNVIFGTTTNTTIGYFCVGSHLADVYLHFCEGDQATYGFLYDGAYGVNPYDVLDVHLVQFVADQCTTGVCIQNLPAAGGMINIDGLWFASRNDTNNIGLKVLNASGVHVRGAQLYSAHPNAFGILLRLSSDCSVTQCVMKGQFVENIYLDGAAYCTVFGNTVVGSVSSGQAGIAATSCAGLSIANNVVRGISGVSLMSYGIYISGDCANISVTGNVVDRATVTYPLTQGSTSAAVIANVGF